MFASGLRQNISFSNRANSSGGSTLCRSTHSTLRRIVCKPGAPRAGGGGQTLMGGAAGKVTRVGASGTTFENSAALFNGDTIKNLDPTDIIDIAGLGYATGSTSLHYTPNVSNTGGVLAVSVGGSVKTAINLVGSFNPSGFAASGGADTFVSYH